MRWLGCVLLSGCGVTSRAALFSSIPEFELAADLVDEGVQLSLSGVQPAWVEDDLCDEDDGESCKDDRFVGFAFYRSDEGPYGAYEALAVDPSAEWLDPGPPLPETAWRAAIVRQEEGDSERLEQVSIAAALPVE
jgi:hypothetical protein